MCTQQARMHSLDYSNKKSSIDKAKQKSNPHENAKIDAKKCH